MNVNPSVLVRRVRQTERTLRLERPFGATLLLSLVLLVFVLGSVELIARSRYFKAHVTSIDIGSAHGQFELQRGRLEMVVADGGPIECIFLGNSMVWNGFSPAVFARTIHRETGREMRCFNFGVDGMPPSGAAAIASVLVEDYHPRYLIYGTDARDYAVPPDARDAVVLLETPWLRYRRGEFSVNGWLYEHVHFLRYRETLGYLLRLEKLYLVERNAMGLNSGAYGFGPSEVVADHVHTSPLGHQDIASVRYYLGLLSDYTIHPENVQALEEIAALNGDGTQVILVEMPIPETYLDFFGQGEEDYDHFVDLLTETAQARNIPFLRRPPAKALPENGWSDYSHLNVSGARIFSHWLGRKLARDGIILAAQP